jgi:hypothetical protein
MFPCAQAVIWGAHPRNNLRRNSSFVSVWRLKDGRAVIGPSKDGDFVLLIHRYDLSIGISWDIFR